MTSASYGTIAGMDGARAGSSGDEDRSAAARERIEALDEGGYREAVPALARLLVDAVESGAAVSFLAGLDEARAAAWWAGRAPAVADGSIVPYVARRQEGIVGVTLLILATTENAPHRAEIAKVIVASAARRSGIATRLLAAAEAGAVARGRTLLLLDTVTGGPAERLYARLGWRTTGSVPGYALDVWGRPEAATFMWKRLDPP